MIHFPTSFTSTHHFQFLNKVTGEGEFLINGDTGKVSKNCDGRVSVRSVHYDYIAEGEEAAILIPLLTRKINLDSIPLLYIPNVSNFHFHYS